MECVYTQMYILWSFEYNLCPSKTWPIGTYTDVKLNIKAYAQDAYSKVYITIYNSYRKTIVRGTCRVVADFTEYSFQDIHVANSA